MLVHIQGLFCANDSLPKTKSVESIRGLIQCNCSLSVQIFWVFLPGLLMPKSCLLWSVTVVGVQCDDRKTTLGQAVVDLLPLLQGTAERFFSISFTKWSISVCFVEERDSSLSPGQCRFSLTVPLYQPSNHPPKDFPGSTYKVGQLVYFRILVFLFLLLFFFLKLTYCSF